MDETWTLLRIIEELNKIINELETEYYEEIIGRQYEIINDRAISEIEYKRTPYSKSKYITIYKNLSLFGYSPILISRKEADINEYILMSEKQMNYNQMIDYLKNCILIYERYIDMWKNIRLAEPKQEPEPIKPKGNPYVGEFWKDRKHKFKSKR